MILDHRAAQQECDVANPQDTYMAPQIPVALLGELQQQLGAHKNVQAVWLAQKVLTHGNADRTPVYIIAFQPKGIYLDHERLVRSVTQSLQLLMDLFVVSLHGDTKILTKKVKKVGRKIS